MVNHKILTHKFYGGFSIFRIAFFWYLQFSSVVDLVHIKITLLYIFGNLGNSLLIY